MRQRFTFGIAVSEFTHNIIKILKGTVASQLLLIAATPALTRLYSPKDFGDLAVFVSWYSILVGIFTLKFELAIILPESDRASMNLMKLTLILSLGLSSLLLVVLIYIRLFMAYRLPSYYFLLPVLTFIGALYSVLQQWFSRNKKFQISAHSVVVSAFCNVSLCFLLYGYLPSANGKLIIAYSAGFLLATGYLIFFALRQNWTNNRSGAVEIMRLFKEYSSFPKYMLPTALLSVLSYQITPLLLARFFDAETVGFYSVANRFLMMPSVLLGAAVGEVFRVELVGKINRLEDIQSFFLGTLKKLLITGIPVFVVAYFISPYIFELILGKKFYISGVFSQYLCLAALGQFIAQPFNYVFVAQRKMRLNLILQSALSLVPVVALTVGGGIFNSIETSLLLLSGLTFIVAVVFVYFVFTCIRKSC